MQASKKEMKKITKDFYQSRSDILYIVRSTAKTSRFVDPSVSLAT